MKNRHYHGEGSRTDALVRDVVNARITDDEMRLRADELNLASEYVDGLAELLFKAVRERKEVE